MQIACRQISQGHAFGRVLRLRWWDWWSLTSTRSRLCQVRMLVASSHQSADRASLLRLGQCGVACGSYERGDGGLYLELLLSR